jgi:hypothetical protein
MPSHLQLLGFFFPDVLATNSLPFMAEFVAL